MDPYDVAPTPATRSTTDANPDTLPADMRSAAGNQAMVDVRQQAGQLRLPLLELKEQLLRDYQEREELLLELEGLEESKEITERGKEAKAELTARQERALDAYAKADADLLLLDQPGVADGQLNELLARRGATADVAASNQKVSKNTVDASGWALKVDDKTTLTQGQNTTVSGKSQKFELGSGGPAYTSGISSDTTEVDSEGGTTKTSSSVSNKYDTSGWSRTSESNVELGDYKAGTKESFGVKRGDGKLGTERSITTSQTGTEVTKTSAQGVIAGPDGAGAYKSATAGLGQTSKSGVKTGQTVGMDGKFVVDVKKVEGSEPAQYQVSLTINLGAKAGLTGSKEWEQSAAGTNSDASGSANVSASLTGTFVHLLSDEDTKKYLAALDAKGTGGAGKEFDVIRAAAKGSYADAQQLLSGLKTAAFSPAGAAAMAEGDSVDLEVGGTADAKLSGGGSGGGFGLKAEGGVTAGETLKRTVAVKGGKVVITISVATTKGWSAGGTASMEAASGGYTHGSTSKAGESVTFTLDPKDSHYNDDFALIADRATIADLRKLGVEHPDLISASTTSSGESTSDSVTAGVAGVSLGIDETHSLDRSVTKDESGTTTSVTGSTGGGASVSALGGKLSYSEKETAAMQVGPGNVGSGDISKSTSETDFGATWDKLKETWSKTPVGLGVGLVTGGAKVAQEKTDVAGMKLDDNDFSIIFGVAQDSKAWSKPVASPRHFAAWQATGRTVAASGGDRQKIADALAAYAAEHDGAAAAITSIVRSPGSAEGGKAYEWPNDMAAEKAVFDSLVDGDPLKPVTALETSGKNKEALESIDGSLKKLDKLTAGLEAKKDQFTTSALGEMLGRLAEQRRALATRSSIINRRVEVSGVDAPAVTTVPTAEDQAAGEKAGAKAALEGMLPALRGFEADQTRQFQLIGAERSKRDGFHFSSPSVIVMVTAFNELRDHVYPLWEKAVDKALETAKMAGVDLAEVKPRPAKGWCNSQYKEEFGQEAFVAPRTGVDW
ncbi:hypothetical protein GCM10009554_13240 [Kribbella koreensis]|uniref:Uncharacterized protein n=1 Tax=Kribbella koreensis TaxID=57909 RepID=A0ABN1PM69_9ACTN